MAVDRGSRRETARILEVSTYPPPRCGWGVRVSYVRDRLRQGGHDCDVLNLGPNRRIRSPDYVDVQDGVDFVRKVVRFVRRGYLVHTHVNGGAPKGLMLAVAAELIARALGRGSVLTFHAGPEQRWFPRHRSRRYTPLFQLAFRLPRRIICNSEAEKASLLTYGLAPERVAPMAAFSAQYLSHQTVRLPDTLRAFVERSEPAVMCYLWLRAQLFPESTVRAIGLAARRLPRLGLVLVGRDTETSAAAALVDREGLADRVYRAGDLTHDEFMTLVAAAHFYVRTQPSDGVSSSVLEALSVGTPVIACENGRRPDSVLTYAPGDATALADRLVEAWGCYAAVRQSVARPSVVDTVQQEADLLVTEWRAGETSGRRAGLGRESRSGRIAAASGQVKD